MWHVFFNNKQKKTMSKTEIIDDNEFFTVGITEHERGVYVPFFQSHEVKDDFEEELPLKSRELALLRLAEIVIGELDEICDDVDLEEDDFEEKNGDEDESNGDDEPSISLVGGTLPHKEDF
jgi:hypothetical protein